MNRIYRLVWNASLNLWVAVAENARGRGKGGSVRGSVLFAPAPEGAADGDGGFVLSRTCRAALVLLTSMTLLTQQAHAANAADANVTAGAGNVSTVGNATTIHQASQRLAIDWTSLSTAAQEALIFNQPNAQAIALNRITGSSPSELLGSLTANGQVFILNPNGVLFGAGSQVNVGGLVASTLSMSDADFMAGNHVFSNKGSSASVVNLGNLNAGQGGYLALLAPEVRNEGVMVASLGTALLAAGNKVTLKLDNGSLLGYSIDQGAINALAENRQLIQADGGQVLLSAKAMDKLTTATVNNTGVIEARTLQNKAGRIMLMGDMDAGTVNAGGTLDASAPNTDGMGGDGGFIETSAAHVKVADGAIVTTAAAQGRTGTWLIDPTDFTIAGGSGAQTNSGIGATTLSNNLANTSVILATDNSGGTGQGDINVNAAVSWSADTTLTLNAYNNINVNAAITATGTNAGLVLNYGNYAAAGSAASGTGYNIAAPITLSGSGATLAINGTAYTLVRSMAALAAISTTDLNGSYALAGDLDASGTTYNDSLVGNASGSPFTGTFTGLGHTIRNLAISAGSGNHVGLFASTTTSSMIRDIGLVGGSVSGFGSNMGALVGTNLGIIRNAYATGSVSGGNSSHYLGGLVGFNSGSISNAYATGNVSGNYEIGGLVGTNLNGSISNSYAAGSVSGSTNFVGGLVGLNQGGSIAYSYATGSVSGGSYVGALAGGSDSTVTASFWLNSISGTGFGWQGGTIDSFTRGLSASEATSAGTYTAAGWNAATTGGSSAVWRIYDGYTGPMLRSFMTALTVTSGNASKTYDGSAALSSSYTLSDSGANTSLILGTAAYSAGSKNVGSYSTGISGLYSGQQGYDISYANGTATITAATLTVSGTSAANKTYDGTDTATVNGSLGGLIGGDSVSLNQSGTFADKNAATGKTVSYTSSISGADAGNYVLASGSGTTTADITAATLTVGGTTAASKTYDGTDTATVGGGTLNGVFGGDNVSLGSQSGTFSDKNAAAGKTVTITNTLSGTDASNYVVAAASTTADITAATLTVSGSTAANKTYDGTNAAAVSGGTLSGAIGGDNVTLGGQGGTFSDKNAATGKTVAITSSLSGTDAGNYVVAAATTTADITARALTITGVTADNKVYDQGTGATVNTAGAVYNGLIAGDAVVVSATGQFTDKNAANGKTVNLSSSYSGADIGNYTITGQTATTANITPKALTVTGVTADNKVYDQGTGATVNTGGAVYSGLIGGDAVVVSATGQFTDKNAANGKTVNLSSSYSGADVGNYTITDQATTTANITPKALTVTGVTADNKVYDQGTGATVNTAGAVYNGLIAGDAVVVSATGEFTDKNAANGKTVNLSSSYAGADVGNYTITGQTITTANITPKALTITGVTADNKVYDQGTGATVNTGGAVYSGLIGGDAVVVSATGEFTDKNAANGKTVNLNSSYAGADVGNYTITGQATATADISRAVLTISGITAADKSYNASDAATVSTAGASYGGLFAGDVVSVTATGLFSDKNAGAGKTVALTSSYSGADAGNYTITGQATTTASISQASLTVSSTDVSRTYDGTTAAAGTATVTGGTLFAGDSLSGGTFAFTDKNAGTGNKTVTATGVTVGDGVNNGNYAVTYADNTTSTIHKAGLTVTAGGVDKVYDGTTAAVVVYGDNRVAGDALDITGVAGYGDRDAGAGKAVNVNGIALGGTDAGNYTLLNTTAATTAGITPKALTVVANDDAQMGGNPYSGGNGVTYSGLAAGDTAAAVLTGKLAYGGNSQGASLPGDYDIMVSGLLANGNYRLSFTKGRLTLSGGDVASAALGGNTLAGPYGGVLASVNAPGLLPHVDVESGGDSQDGATETAALNAAAAEQAGGE